MARRLAVLASASPMASRLMSPHISPPVAASRLTSPRMMSTYGAESPFILLARCHVKPEFAAEHLEAARVADAGVKETEPGA